MEETEYFQWGVAEVTESWFKWKPHTFLVILEFLLSGACLFALIFMTQK